MSSKELEHEPGALFSAGDLGVVQVCRVCGLLWASDVASDPVCPAKLAARVPRPRCRWSWMPGVLSPIRERQRCLLDANHEGPHRLPETVEASLRRMLGDDEFERLVSSGPC